MRIKTGVWIITLFTMVTVGACSSPETTETVVETAANPYRAGFEAFDKGNWQEAEKLINDQLESAEEKSYYALIGLAKAQMQKEDYSSAKDTLLQTKELYPDQTSVLYYLAASYDALEDYENATDAYYSLLKKGEGSDALIDALMKACWNSGDQEQIYELTKEVYQSDTDHNYSDLLLKACSLFQDDAHEQEVVGLLPESDREIVRHMMMAYHMYKEGDDRAALDELHKIEEFDDITLKYETYYGDIVSSEYDGIVIAYDEIFRENGFIIGQYKDGGWSGEGRALGGYDGTTRTTRNDITYQGRYLARQEYSGTWVDGIPEGEVLLIDTYESVFENEELNNKNRQETTFQFVNGKAEGHTETIEYYYRKNKDTWEPDIKIVHEFKEGEPQPFWAQTEDGELEVYENATFLDGYGGWYESTDCGHDYIWKK